MEAISHTNSSAIRSTPATSSTSILGHGDHPKCQQSHDYKPSKAVVDRKPAGVVKSKQSKSRNGCSTCKAKRLKCDETKPICNQCVKRKVTCGGYKKDFKWRAFVDAGPRTLSSIAAEKNWSQDGLHSSGSTMSLDGGSTLSSSTSSNTPQPCPLALRRTPSLSSELTFPTPEELLDRSRKNSRAKHGNVSNSFMKLRQISPPTPTDKTIPFMVQKTLKSPFESSKVQHHTYLIEQLVKEEDVEEIPRRDINSESAPAIVALSSSSSSSSSGFGLSVAFNQPRLATNSPEMLALNFDRNTCGILSVKDGISENPWRTLIWPMAKDSPALFHAIASLSAFHCSVGNHGMKLTGMNHMSQSISQLYQNINNMNIEQSLATSMALALADTWDTSISTGKEHVRGGSVLISQALTKMKNQQFTTDTSTLRFLCNTWLYMDVLSRLTSTQIDDADMDSPLWSQIDLLSTSDEIDPLLGCASTLFPVIGRVANLVSKVRRIEENSLSLISRANDLKQELLNWSPPSYLQTPEDPTCAIQHSIQTAEAYQWATLLYLHQAVPEIPSRSAQSLAQKVLLRLATVPVQSRTVIVHIYPLLAASCELTSADDRAWALERWTQMHRRMQISNIERCIEVVKEVWSRRDQARLRNQQSRMSGSMLYNDSSIDFDNSPIIVSRPVMAHGRDSQEGLQMLPFARTVRGNQHWAGIMKELNWEVMLG